MQNINICDLIYICKKTTHLPITPFRIQTKVDTVNINEGNKIVTMYDFTVEVTAGMLNKIS